MAKTETDAVEQLQINFGIDEADRMRHLTERWAKAIDNAAYLIFEHRIKEKEYGIKWRTAYKAELKEEAMMLRGKFGEHLGDQEFEDFNHVISELVLKDFTDVQKMKSDNDFGLMVMLDTNICQYEISLTYLRKILKTPDLHEILGDKSQPSIRDEVVKQQREK